MRLTSRWAAYPALVAFAAVAGCGGGGSSGSAGSDLLGGGVAGGNAGDGTSGVRGTVTRGPLTPVQVQGGPPDTAPLPGAPIAAHACDAVSAADVCTRVGPVVGRATSGADGGYSIPLAPGIYVVYGEAIGGSPGGLPRPVANDAAVTVPAGAFVRADVSYDTGIR